MNPKDYSLSKYLYLFLIVCMSGNLAAQCDGTIHFDLNGCTAYTDTGSNADYSEFTATITSSSDFDISVLGDNLYRTNPENNTHSCTEGVNGTEAMCVSYDMDCDYNPGNERSIKFDVLLTPTSGKPVALSMLSLIEKAPVTFSWIDGPSGDNNYPTLFGIRILKNGLVAYEQSGIPTNRDWTTTLVDLSFEDALIAEEMTLYNFEILAYCPIGIPAMISAWDIDDITLTANCIDMETCVDSLGNEVLVEGGEVSLANGSTVFNGCVGDIVLDVQNNSSANMADYYYVITDNNDNILAFADANTTSTLDLSGAPEGECHIWGWSQLGQSDPISGNHISTLNDDICEAISSNFIQVLRSDPNGGSVTGGPFEFCVGDGIVDNVSGVSVSDNSGSNSQWVITDDQGNILGLPPTPEAVDFDGAGIGTCLIWHLSYETGLQGLSVGNNASTDLVGCYSLSNAVSVNRIECNAVSGGTITGGPFEFCVGDGMTDNVSGIDLTGNMGTNSQWVITDGQGVILGLPPTPEVVDFDGAGQGVCLIWHLSYEPGLSGLAVDNSVSVLTGDFDFSNSISVTRNDPNGGLLTGGPFEFCGGDGVADNVSGLTIKDVVGTNSQWVVTDDQGVILGLPPTPEAVDFDGAGFGTCLIWHLSYENGLTGLTLGNNANSDLSGCYSLSNPIEVNRVDCVGILGGTLEGGPFSFCVGDGIEDNVFEILLSGNNGSSNQWIVTDAVGEILGLPNMIEDVDFDGAGAGNCLIYNVSYNGTISGLDIGQNLINISGDFALSNSLTVFRSQPEGGTLSGGPFEFCVGDGVADVLSIGSVLLVGASGAERQWVITSDVGEILGLPINLEDVNFEDAGVGTCLIWNLSFEVGLEGLDVGNNAFSDLVGCFEFSNNIIVSRIDCGSGINGGILSGGPFVFCVGDGIEDNVSGITIVDNVGPNNQWVVTSATGEILGLPDMPSDVNFDTAPPGVCLIWNIAYTSGIGGLDIGSTLSGLTGTYDLSNSIGVVRNQPVGGVLSGGPFTFCVSDGIADTISNEAYTLIDDIGFNSQWVVTDEFGNILGLPPTLGAVNFDGAGVATCFVWHLSYEEGLEGLMMGNNALTDLMGCHDLSNALVVNRIDCDTTINGGNLIGGPFEFCVGDGISDFVSGITLTDNSGSNNQWLITNPVGDILGLPAMPGDVDFDGAGEGVCLIWNLSFEGSLTGLMEGNNISVVNGDYALSNAIFVTRHQPMGGALYGGPFTFCVGDGTADNLPDNAITLTGAGGGNSQWVVTDEQGIILGLPPTPQAVDFDDAGVATCLIWHLSYADGLQGAEMGNNAMTDLEGCYSLSNAVTVNRINCNSDINGGNLVGGPFEFCVGDGIADNVSDVSLSSSSGMNNQWVITDENGNILGLPPSPEAVDFDGAGSGVCLIWNISFDGSLTGLDMGNNVSSLVGEYAFSNSIPVTRNGPIGGKLSGGPFEFCVGDGIADMILPGEIELEGNEGTSQWVITDDLGNILGLPGSPEDVDFDDAGIATCLVWHLSYTDEIDGLEMGNNAMTDLIGCYNISNSITVNRIDCGTIGSGMDSIVINEILPNNRFELKNVGDETIDVSNYFICNFPAYAQLSSLVIECGTDLILEPGELVTLVASFGISNDDGEMALYNTPSYSDPEAIIDYVEWGRTGHTRSNVAVAAEIWTSGDFAPAITAGSSLEYDGLGNMSTDWKMDVSTPCIENNFTSPNPKNELKFRTFPNPSVDKLILDFTSVTSDQGLIFVYDRLGNLMIKKTINFEETLVSDIDISDLPEGSYFVKVISKSRWETKRFIKIR
ncbi:MAG: T9SS type A sorting domain-containing protein [Bacteroidia bacterium]|nr:T9SS type A sorting domain-containing protein [Bacteroidia bacterium]